MSTNLKLTQRGKTLGFTTAEQDFDYEDCHFKSQSIIEISSLSAQTERKQAGHDMQFSLSTERLDMEQFIKQSWQHAVVEIFRLHHNKNKQSLLTAVIGDIASTDMAISIQLLPYTHVLNVDSAHYYSQYCRARFGDKQCGINREQYKGKTCDKRFATCINQFNNAINFRGEPHVPGQDIF